MTKRSNKTRTLQAKAAELQALWDDLLGSPPPHTRAGKAAKQQIVTEYEELRASLARRRKHIPPLTGREQ